MISFEGIEGSGKSTQCRYLISDLRRRGLKVEFLREPGSSYFGEKIREILLFGKGRLNNFCEMLLFIAARTQLVEEKIKKAFAKKDVIVLDRYIDATVAYQGYAGGQNIEMINLLNKHAASGAFPDLTILLDLPVKTGLSRCSGNDRFEKRGISFHEKVRSGYLELARKNPQRIKKISALGLPEEVRERIRKTVDNALNSRRRKK